MSIEEEASQEELKCGMFTEDGIVELPREVLFSVLLLALKKAQEVDGAVGYISLVANILTHLGFKIPNTAETGNGNKIH